jgi:hypothetical protein
MIQEGSTVVLMTDEALFSPCEVVSLSRDNIVVTYFEGMKKDRKTGKVQGSYKTATIPFKKIVKLEERL